MKKPCQALVVAALLGLLPGCASRENGSVTVRRQSYVDVPYRERPGGWNLNVSRGDSKQTVFTLCGRPDFAIGDDIWIYWNTGSAEGAAETDDYNTLVVVFVDNRVDSMRLVNGDDLRSRFTAMAARGQPKK